MKLNHYAQTLVNHQLKAFHKEINSQFVLPAPHRLRSLHLFKEFGFQFPFTNICSTLFIQGKDSFSQHRRQKQYWFCFFSIGTYISPIFIFLPLAPKTAIQAVYNNFHTPQFILYFIVIWFIHIHPYLLLLSSYFARLFLNLTQSENTHLRWVSTRRP